MSERGGLANLSSQMSAREVGSLAAGNKKYQGAASGRPDLLPIDEDVDDEKCSPIKPKRRTSEDSPFKKHLSGKRNQDGNHEKPLTISSVEDDERDIAVGGFGL